MQLLLVNIYDHWSWSALLYVKKFMLFAINVHVVVVVIKGKRYDEVGEENIRSVDTMTK